MRTAITFQTKLKAAYITVHKYKSFIILKYVHLVIGVARGLQQEEKNAHYIHSDVCQCRF